MLPLGENYQGLTPRYRYILRAKIVELLAVGFKARLVSNPEHIATVVKTRDFRRAGAASLFTTRTRFSGNVDYTPVEPDPLAPPLRGLWELPARTARHVCPFRNTSYTEILAPHVKRQRDGYCL